MAVKALEQGVPTFESKGPNLALFAQIDLGSAYAESQELEEGSRLLGYAFTELAKMGNTRGTRRIQHARSRLEPWRDEPAVRDLDERINSGLTALTN
ncbi:MAG: hypothetical protein ACREN8_09080 [Candidatus Dormibacteraceae bacterium]